MLLSFVKENIYFMTRHISIENLKYIFKNYLMKNIFIIGAYKLTPYTNGKLNETLFKYMLEKFDNHFEIATTTIATEYNIDKEVEKFNRADNVIFQTPIFWFSLPGALKVYIDDVFKYGIFYKGSEKPYGENGLLKNKKYMFSLTWNAPESAFANKNANSFFQNKSVDEIIIAIHKTMQFVGMKPLETFNAFDVIHKPDIEKYLKEFDNHLERVFF